MIKANIISNLISSLIIAFLPAISFPIYLNFLGSDQFGLFSFYFIMIVYFKILDFGFSTTFNKFVASNSKNNEGKAQILNLMRSFEILFLVFSILIFLSTFYLKNYLSANWFLYENLLDDDVQKSLLIIALIISSKVFISLYRGGINGMEKQVILNIVKLFFEIFSVIGGLTVFFYFSKLKIFELNFLFIFFLILTLIELVILRSIFTNFIKISLKINFSVKPFLKSLRFIFSVGMISFCWFFTLWFERFIFSGSLSLKEYGYYVTFSLLSGVSLLLTAQTNTAFFPRATYLNKERKQNKMIDTLHYVNHFNNSIIFSITLLLVVFSEQILIVWTGSSELASWSYIPLTFFSIGYLFISVSHTLTTLLTSKGYIKILLNTNLVWMIILCCGFYFASKYLDINWASFFWLVANFILFVFLYTVSFVKLNLKNEIRVILKNFIKHLTLSSIMFLISYYVLFEFIFYQRFVLFFQLSFLFFLFFIILLFSDTRTFYKLKKLFFYFTSKIKF